MPNQPKTPLRNVRIPDDVWEAAKQKAEAEGRNVSAVIREHLEQWAAK